MKNKLQIYLRKIKNLNAKLTSFCSIEINKKSIIIFKRSLRCQLKMISSRSNKTSLILRKGTTILFLF